MGEERITFQKLSKEQINYNFSVKILQKSQLGLPKVTNPLNGHGQIFRFSHKELYQTWWLVRQILRDQKIVGGGKRPSAPTTPYRPSSGVRCTRCGSNSCVVQLALPEWLGQTG